MKTGHAGSDCSFKLAMSSHAMKRARTLFSAEPIQLLIRSTHCGMHCKNCAEATDIRAPRISVYLCRNCSSPHSSSSSSSSSSARPGTAPAARWSLRSLWAHLVRSSDWSIKVNILGTICPISSAARTPGPTLLMHCVMPLAVSPSISGLGLPSRTPKVFPRPVRKSSPARLGGRPRSLAPSRATLISSAQFCSAIPRTSSQR
mmetsp:Transcript_24483/g.70282  ORF Transcript_24483/g.70282 Transcript_24483/m.70282 type:complete len:203 (-) Transcript_24483:2304-2912(-)